MLGKQAGANKPGPQSLRLCLLHEGVAGANNPGRQSLRLCLLHEGVAGANKPGRQLLGLAWVWAALAFSHSLVLGQTHAACQVGIVRGQA